MYLWKPMALLFFHSLVSTRQVKRLSIKALSPNYSPTTLNQQKYVNALRNEDIQIVLGVGPAGTGKTLFACNTAVEQLKAGTIKKIVLTRPLVSVEEEIGFLPGNLISKMDPWTRPIFDILQESYSKRDMDTMLQTGVIEISPLAFMRGRTFKHAFIIADEMQNSSPNQMLMITTRLGTNSKMVITGDLKQSDRMENNGLYDLIQKLKEAKRVGGTKGIELVEMDQIDIKRSEIVSTILNIYNPTPRPSSSLYKSNGSEGMPTIDTPNFNRIFFETRGVMSGSSLHLYKGNGTDDAALLPKSGLPKRNYTAHPYHPAPFYC
jgi:phosphate starvation-inducible protein PhoH and related proteins